MPGFGGEGLPDEIGRFADGGSDTSHDAAFGEPLTDVRHGAHDLLHATDGIRGLGVAHLVEHRGEFSRGVRCGAADGSDSSGDILDPVRTLEFGQTLLESLEDIFPLVGTALLARLEQLGRAPLRSLSSSAGLFSIFFSSAAEMKVMPSADPLPFRYARSCFACAISSRSLSNDSDE